MADLTDAQGEWLDELLRMEGLGFAGMMSGRMFRKSEADGLVTAGMLEAKSLQVCDGDGFAKQPEKFRRGYVLTERGRAEAIRRKKENDDHG